MDKLDEEALREVLTSTLEELALEDVNDHGRLLAIQDILAGLFSNG